jgi:transcriptional regulator with XRE-family HTH domain
VAIGDRMRAARKAAGLTQEGVARRSGLTLKHIGEVERGEVHDPHYSTLSAIAGALGTTVAQLVGEEAPVPLDEASNAGLPEDLDELMHMARALKAEWARLLNYDRIACIPGEYERVRPRLNEIERDLDKLRRRAQELDAPKHMIMRWPNRPPKVVFFEEPTPADQTELEAQYGEYEEEKVFELERAV